MTNSIYKGDNTGAFGNQFITINLGNIPEGYSVSRADVYVNSCLFKTFQTPVFPLRINFTSEETLSFRSTNVVNLEVWDDQNRNKQCKGSLVFDCQNGVISNVRRNCC